MTLGYDLKKLYKQLSYAEKKGYEENGLFLTRSNHLVTQ